MSNFFWCHRSPRVGIDLGRDLFELLRYNIGIKWEVLFRTKDGREVLWDQSPQAVWYQSSSFT